MKKPSLKINFLMNIILTISSFLFPLITFPYISRILQPAGTGKVAFATSLISYFALFSQLGIPTYGVRACAAVRDDKQKLSQMVQELLIICLLCSLLSYILFLGAVFFVPRLAADKSLYLIMSVSILLSGIGMEWLYKALEQYTYIALRSILFKIIALIFMFLFVHEQSDYRIYGAISIFAASAGNVCNFVHAFRYIEKKPCRPFNFKRHLKPVFIFFAMSCATTIYTNLDTVMLGFMCDDEAVGYYNAAVKIKNILVSVVTSLSVVLMPRASYYVEQGKMKEFESLSLKALLFVIMLSLPLSLYFILFAKEGVLFLSGEGYAGAIAPMQVLMPTLVLIGITNILGIQVLVPLKKEKEVLYSVLLGAIVDLILNAFLIPSLASLGAAIGTLAAESAVLLLQAYYLRDFLKGVLPKLHGVQLAISLLAASLACFWCKSLAWGSFWILCLSAILFFGVFVLVLLLFKNELLLELIENLLASAKKFIYSKKKASA
jgi:O-antigen/teichoic acid export membrane protein